MAIAPAIAVADEPSAAPSRVAPQAALRLGVIAPTRAEGRVWTASGAGEVTSFASGADGVRARDGAERLAEQGVAALVSFGLAAGLAPVSRPGDVIVADGVVLPGGGTIRTDDAWRGALLACLSVTATRVVAARVAGRDHPVTTPETKRGAFRETFAAALDTESHAVAEVAAARGLPFIVVRAIDHAVEETCPCAVSIGERLARSVWLAAHPLALPGVWRHARNRRAARAALGRIAAVLPRPATA